MSKLYWKNPLMIDNVFIEKEEFDLWLAHFRKRESELDTEIMQSSNVTVVVDAMLMTFEESSAANFKDIFGANIKVNKIVRNSGGVRHICPAIIDLSNKVRPP